MNVSPASALSARLTVNHVHSDPCINFHTESVAVKATFRLHQHGAYYWGSVSMKGVKHDSITQQVFSENLGRELVGTFIIYDSPFYADAWHLITAVVELSPDGSICHPALQWSDD